MDKCANMLPDHTHTLSARLAASECMCVWLVFFAPLLSFTFLFYSIPLCFVCNSFALLRSAQLSSALRAFVCARPRATSNVVGRAQRPGGAGQVVAGGIFYKVRLAGVGAVCWRSPAIGFVG